MKIRHYTQHHITFSLARSGALLMLLLLFSIGCLLPGEVNAAAITCSAGVSGCHFAPTTTPMIKDGTGRNVPGGRFTGSHAKHSGYSTSSAKGQYLYACTVCHGLAGGYNNAHQTGFKNVSSSNVPGNRYSAGKKIANTNSPAFGNCGNIYCHSTGRSAAMGQIRYSSVRWGGTKTCLGCHGGRASATGAPARSVGNFTLSTSHSQHLKYPAANINCQICHSKTTQTDAWTLKTYTAATHHVNGVSEVEFTNLAYASYTSYKKAGVNLYKCSNTSCHGGLSRSAWSATVQNSNHTCTHCHGVGTGVAAGMSVTGANRYNLRFFAPGWNKTGTSTDQTNSSNNVRVGSHFKHLSSVYMKNIKCNECHKVPDTPFQAGTNHTLNTTRFNSGTLDFSQSTSARILIGVASGSTPAQLSAFAGYTNGTAIKASTCSSVYCHGSRLKTGDTSGTVRTPYWNYSSMINYTNPAVACSRCHGNPPTAGTSAGSHSGQAATSSCNDCHSHVTTSGTFFNKALHINGQVEASASHAKPYYATDAGHTGCLSGIGCHTNSAPTAVYPAGGTPNCRACHQKADPTVSSNGCGSCHGAANGNGQPNGTVHPDAVGSHVKHTAMPTATCAYCHTGGGTGTNAAHGQSSAGTNVVNITAALNWSSGPATCSTIYCHSTGRATGMGTVSYTNSVAWGSTGTCLSCHGGRNGANPARSTGNFTLSTTHSQHLKYPSANINCQHCHPETASDAATLNVTTGAAKHANNVRDVHFTAIAYGSYTSYKSTEAGSANNTKICGNTSCHGGKTRASWSATVQNSNHNCTHCHGVGTGVAAGMSVTGANRYNLRFFAPGWNKTGTSTDQTNSSNDRRVGSHFKHLSSVYMKNIKCNECHKVPSTAFSADTNHTLNTTRFNSGTLDFSQSSSAKILIGVASGSTPAQLSAFAGYTNGTATKASTCSSVYCHGSRLKTADTSGTVRTPYWNFSSMINYTNAAVACSRCHGNPPTAGTSAGSHSGKAATSSCNGCHSHVTTTGTFSNKALHINGQVESSSSCIGCHASAQGTRSNVVGEFTLAWGHKKTGRGAVTDADCVVCHLEGKYSGAVGSAIVLTAFHSAAPNGNIDLRDPDTNGEVAITNNSGAAFTFTKFSLDLTTARTSAITNSVADVITQKFCLKCHDAGGATNTSARAGSSPTANAPFGGGFTAINNAAEFATANSSKHPVLGPLSRDYPTATRLAVPFKPAGTRGTSGTKTNGVVMNCFDCHNAPTTPLLTRTVSAHGNANTIRGTVGVATPTLCAICHLGYTASTTVGHNSGSLTSGSAFSSAENRMQTEQDNCNYCHADVLAPARPARATNVHGTNVLPAGTKTGRWALGTAQSVPVAFIRNTTYMSNHQPKNVAGTAYAPQCSMVTCASRAGSPYSLGGTY